MSDEKNLTNQPDPIEVQEWRDSIKSLVKYTSLDYAQALLGEALMAAREEGVQAGPLPNYTTNSIHSSQEPEYPGDIQLEERIDAINRWNAMMIVLRAGKKYPGIGGHISTPCSVSRLYNVGLNHFFHASNSEREGDLVFFQGHATPINYARDYLSGYFSEEQLNYFRQEVETDGLSSYPHPWLMPQYWQFPTVSMGLSAIQAIYQAHCLKYLNDRGLKNTENRKVWAFCGDGEMDEPESRGALSMAARYQLDNLIFVINCNLQRLDGPVYGNGSIIRELANEFTGCGWHVITALWGSQWDPIFAKDNDNLITNRMKEMVDGEFQNYSAKEGAYIREHFFNSDALKTLISDLSDNDLSHLFRDGLAGHDFKKIYAAYDAATKVKNKPVVILIQSVKGYGLGAAGEAQNIAHNVKKMDIEQMRYVRDRFNIPLTDAQLEKYSYYHPGKDSPEVKYLKQSQKQLGGQFPQRRQQSTVQIPMPSFDEFLPFLKDSGDREVSNTMVFVRILNALMKDKGMGQHIVPIVPDESRSFGMEGMFRQFGIYSHIGQVYTPVDREQLMYYRQAKDGQVLEEGITEAGCMASWMALGSAYSASNYPMIPFFIYYSMFGFQRVGDMAWAAADMRTRGFLIGGTAGRTTLSGEGLQHTDGHSHVFSSVIPNCVSYDTCYSYELAVVIYDGLRRMYKNNEDIFYYLTVTNENYFHPEMPKGVEEGIIKGMYLLKRSKTKHSNAVQLLGSGTLLREAEAAAEILEKEYEVNANVWSVTSYTELRREGLSVRRANLLHPDAKAKLSYVEECLKDAKGPVVAVSDYIRSFADQIREFVPAAYITLGTDGFGRSDARQNLRHFHEVDRRYIVINALKALADEGKLSTKVVTQAIKKLGINPEKPNPVTV